MTLRFYGVPCSSTRQAKAWLKKHDIPFIEKNIMKNPLTIEELQNILSRTIEGTDEIIATRSKAYQELDQDIDTFPLQELLKLIQEHPTLMRSPIMMDEKRFQVGYHDDDIRQFLPRKTKNHLWLQWKKSLLKPAEGTL